ncbi:hypothetical protein, partial [Stenotrophomonas maltophilia]|uniref:hypothetical protein n=1 Tax=Stenotrophomonas maltophilia TaxID=40324 RepID=UPI001954FFA8
MAPTVLRSPSRPAPDSFLRVPATEENQKIERSKAKAGRFALSRAWLGPTEDHFDRSSVIHIWRGSTVSTKVDTHQCNMPFRQIAGNCRR